MSSQLDVLLDEVRCSLSGHNGPVALGLDMAANPDNWGFAVLLIERDHQRATLPLLLPHAKINKNRSVSPTLLCRPQPDLIRNVLQMVRESKKAAALAVDVPFGWPVEHQRFTSAWSASAGWGSSECLPPRGFFERRWCDRALTAKYPKIQPLSVGADTLAQAAFMWASFRSQLGSAAEPVDVGEGEFAQQFATFETYPGAFVKLVAGDFGDYNSKPDVRQSLRRALRKQYRLQADQRVDGWMEWACNQKGSPNAFDAFLSALTAWDYLEWRAGVQRVQLTGPEALLGRLPTDQEKAVIRAEGWILIRTTGRDDGPPTKEPLADEPDDQEDSHA
jgi:hypothetical protein